MMPFALLLHQVGVKPLEVGDEAPDVAFSRPDGTSTPLTSFRGRIVVIEFTSLTCAPCLALAPHLEDAARRYPDVVFLTISTDPPAGAAELLRRRPKDAKTIFLMDTRREDRMKMGVWKFGDPGYPSTYVIDRKGRMASRLIMGEEHELEHVEARIAWTRRRL
jgi:peroxiredoxin